MTFTIKHKGHWIKGCPKWIADGKPSKSGVSKSKSKSSNCSFVETATSTLMPVSEEAYWSEPDPTVWWVDNGATRHITNCPDYFVGFEKFIVSHGIKAAGKETLTALGKGNI
jgi:hypothetical protein